MKKISIVLNVVMFSFLLISYKNKGENSMPTNSTAVTVDYKLGIPALLAEDMIKGYRTNVWHQRKINDTSFLDARSVWFSVGKLKAFIADLENKVNGPNGKCLNVGADELGVRIYYAVYPKGQQNWNNKYNNYFTNHNLPTTYQGLHTVLMVPTLYNNTDSLNYDFDPRYITDTNGICAPIPVGTIMERLIAQQNKKTISAGRVMPVQLIDSSNAYMIMPDNLDSKRFISNNNKKSATVTGGSDNIGFTNAGTLVPPPYANKPNAARINETLVDDVGSKKMFAVSAYGFNTTYSGASLMRWVDRSVRVVKTDVQIDLEK